MCENKDKTATVRLSKQEYDILSIKSKELGLTLSAYIRMCALKLSRNE